MHIVDLSVAIADNTPCDPPSMPTRIDYWDHTKGVAYFKTFFPTATDADLPAGLGWSSEYISLTPHQTILWLPGLA